MGNFTFMRHTFVTVKKWLKSVYIYGSYRKTNAGYTHAIKWRH